MNVTLAIVHRSVPVKVSPPGASGMAKNRPNVIDAVYPHMSTVFDNNREWKCGA
jgi:hypothetical protein